MTYSHPGITVTVQAEGVSVAATNGALHDWATRPGHAWPCSELADCTELRADFDTNGLLDIDHPGVDDETLTGDELNAFTSDAIGYALNPEHPCYLVTVGQFRED